MKNLNDKQNLADSGALMASSSSIWLPTSFDKPLKEFNKVLKNTPKRLETAKLYSWHIKKHIGQGSFECLRFTNIVLTRVSCQLIHDIDFVNEHNFNNFNFHIILGGISHYEFYEMNKKISVQSPQVWTQNGRLGSFRRKIPANQTLKKISIGINKDYLTKLYTNSPDNGLLADITKNNYAVFQAMPFSSVKVFELANDLLNLPFNSNKLDQMYIEGMALMLISILLNNSLNDIPNIQPQKASCAKLAAIKVKEYLNSHPYSNKTIKELAYFAGTNSCYLKYEFKQMTSLTIHQYRQQARMQLALKLICDSQKPLSIVAQQLGFKSTDYFIRVFKEYFGQHPKAYRNIANASYDENL